MVRVVSSKCGSYQIVPGPMGLGGGVEVGRGREGEKVEVRKKRGEGGGGRRKRGGREGGGGGGRGDGGIICTYVILCSM